MSIDNAKPEEWHEAAYLAQIATDNASGDPTPRDIERLNQVLDCPFGEVPLVTRAYVFLLHQMGKVHITGRLASEVVRTRPQWESRMSYQVRAIEKPKTKPSIDWSYVAPQYKWLARDANGDAYVYKERPQRGGDAWIFGVCKSVDHLKCYVAGDCDWKDSLVERPAGV